MEIKVLQKQLVVEMHDSVTHRANECGECGIYTGTNCSSLSERNAVRIVFSN